MKGARIRTKPERLGRASAITGALLAIGAGVSVAQSLPNRVLDPSGVLDGTKEESLRWPVAVAAGATGELAVADVFGSRLLIFKRIGAGWGIARSLALPEPPAGVASTRDGGYLVSLRGGARLLEVAAGGVEPTAPRPARLPDGLRPTAVAVLVDGSWVAWDAAGDRIVRLRGGAIDLSVDSRGAAVSAFAGDGSGGFWAAFAELGEVAHYDASGRELARLDVPADSPRRAWPSGLAVEPGGRLYVLDRHAGRIVALDGSGTWVGLGARRGNEPGELYYPSGLARLPSGELIVADLGNGRAQLFRPLGGGRE